MREPHISVIVATAIPLRDELARKACSFNVVWEYLGPGQQQLGLRGKATAVLALLQDCTEQWQPEEEELLEYDPDSDLTQALDYVEFLRG